MLMQRTPPPPTLPVRELLKSFFLMRAGIPPFLRISSEGEQGRAGDGRMTAAKVQSQEKSSALSLWRSHAQVGGLSAV